MKFTILSKLLKTLVLGGVLFTALHSTASPLSGKQIASIIRLKAGSVGLEIKPVLFPEKTFYECRDSDVKPLKSNWTLVEFSCSFPNNWSLVVRNKLPVKKIALITKKSSSHLKTDVKEKVSLVSVNKPLRQGETITNSDVYYKLFKTKNGIGGFSDVKDVVGRTLRKSISSGHLLNPEHLAKRWLVYAGDVIKLSLQVGPIRITSNGQLLENGQLGDIVKVRSLASGGLIRGRVLNRNKIVVLAKIKR